MWSFVRWESRKGSLGHGMAFRGFSHDRPTFGYQVLGKQHKESFWCNIWTNDVHNVGFSRGSKNKRSLLAKTCEDIDYRIENTFLQQVILAMCIHAVRHPLLCSKVALGSLDYY